MTKKTTFFAVLFWVLLIPFAKSQVLDQNKLFRLLPEIPQNLTSATEKEVTAFKAQCDTLYNMLTGMEEKYRRSADSETNSALILDYYDIRDSITDLHATERSRYYDLVPLFSDLQYAYDAKNDSINYLIEDIKYNGSKAGDLQVLEQQIVANKAECRKKQAELYLQFLKGYRTKLQNIAEKANKSEIIPMPDHLNKNVSFVLLNVKNYLNYLGEVYQFNGGE